MQTPLEDAPAELEGPVDAHVDSVDALAAALAVDPVNVQQIRGNGHTTEVDAALTDLVDAADVPVVIALVGDLPDLAQDDPAGDLVARLQGRLGQDSVYVVAVGDRGPTWTYDGADPELKDQISAGLRPTYDVVNGVDEAAPRPSDAGEAALIAAVVAAPDHTLTDAQLSTYLRSGTWTEVDDAGFERPPTPSAVGAWSALVGVLVLLVGWRLARTWALRSVTPAPPARPPRSRAQAAGLRPPASTDDRDRGTRDDQSGADPTAAVREDATRILDTLARELTEAGSGPRVEAAIGCRVAAEQVLDSDDLLDVVGALVLARTGASLLRTEKPYRPCFINPLHGRGAVEIEITDAEADTEADTDAGGGRVAAMTVPACRRCGSTRGRSQRLDPLFEPARGLRSPRPYYEGDTLWARTGFGALDTDLWRRVVQER